MCDPLRVSRSAGRVNVYISEEDCATTVGWGVMMVKCHWLGVTRGSDEIRRRFPLCNPLPASTPGGVHKRKSWVKTAQTQPDERQ